MLSKLISTGWHLAPGSVVLVGMLQPWQEVSKWDSSWGGCLAVSGDG